MPFSATDKRTSKEGGDQRPALHKTLPDMGLDPVARPAVQPPLRASEQTMPLESLLLSVGNGNRVAFAELFQRTAPRVKGYLISRGATPEQAEEITQDVMVAVWRKAAGYDPTRAAVTTWIYSIARNRRIDIWRREHKLDLDPHDPMLQGKAPEQPLSLLDTAEQARRVRSAVKALPHPMFQALQLSYFEGLSHGQIAKKLDVPLGTVKSRIRKATQIVGNALDAEKD